MGDLALELCSWFGVYLSGLGISLPDAQRLFGVLAPEFKNWLGPGGSLITKSVMQKR